MKRKTTNSPYPVLYPSDPAFAGEQGYESATFDIAGEPVVQVRPNHNLEVSFQFDLTDMTLLQMVESGQAKYYVNIECGRTYYRKAFLQDSTQFRIEIPYLEVSDFLEIFIGLVAVTNINGFSAPGFADRFGRATFDIEEGDILAAGTGWGIDLEEMDGSPDPYIFVARDSDSERNNSDLWVATANDTLVVHLADEIYQIYFNNAQNDKYRNTLMALVMKPAILSALLQEIVRARQNGAEVDVNSRRWLRKFNVLIGQVLAEEGLEWNIDTVKVDSDRDKGTLAFAVDALLKKPMRQSMFDIRDRKIK